MGYHPPMWLAALLLLSVASTSDQAPASWREQAVFCGGETDVATVERYFSDLRRALTNSNPGTRLNAFVGNRFGVRNARGRTLYFNVRDVGSVTPGRISIQEWREISRRGARSLQNAGWRGCFMDHGKIWFEGSREHGFRLTLIARDMPWVAPVQGDALP